MHAVDFGRIVTLTSVRRSLLVAVVSGLAAVSLLLAGCVGAQLGTFEGSAPVRAPTTRLVSHQTGTTNSCTVSGGGPGARGQVTVDPDPSSVVAEWLPGLNARPCVAVLVHSGPRITSALADQIRLTP